MVARPNVALKNLVIADEWDRGALAKAGAEVDAAFDRVEHKLDTLETHLNDPRRAAEGAARPPSNHPRNK